MPPLTPPRSGQRPDFAAWELKQAEARDSHFLVEKWSRGKFYATGGVLSAAAAASTVTGSPVLALAAVPIAAAWWYVGLKDIKQTRHAVLRNFPVLGHVRYLLEGVRPELRQYFFESDTDGMPFSRMERGIVYSRSKNIEASSAFGGRLDVNADGYEWVSHSMWPTKVDISELRVTLGGRDCKKPYNASRLNISAMSYGALSGNAILALNAGAKRGGFLHNTGEGGVSKFHLAPGGDLTWNIGAGYFGARDAEGRFSPDRFRAMVEANPQIRMIEIKLSQGAKPGKGGQLPGRKVTPEIAEARGVPVGADCLSPARHTAFDDEDGLARFVQQVRDLSGGLPVSVKFCVGVPDEAAAMIQAFIDADIFPDVLTIDGGEGGTGAAPSEFSNSVGMPLNEALTLVDNLLRGSGTRDRVKIIAAGKVVSSLALIRTLALGADAVNAARGFMFALGCIQSLSCARDVCPTGIATQNPDRAAGLDVGDKVYRIYSFHKRTLEATRDMLSAMGINDPDDLTPQHVFKRVDGGDVVTFANLYPRAATGALLSNSAPASLQRVWDNALVGRKARAAGERRSAAVSPSAFSRTVQLGAPAN